MSEAPKSAEQEDDNEWLIGRVMKKLLGRSWRTTSLGILAVACGIVSHVPGAPGALVDLCNLIAAPAGGLGLIFAKDGRVSGLPNAPKA